MEAQEILLLLFQIVAGIALAASAGLRAFLPLFVLGVASRLGVSEMLIGQPLELQPALAWISSTPALIVLGVAVVFEILADKIPAVDHALDLVQTWVRPMAGALVMAASLESIDPIWAGLTGLFVGGSVAGAVHVAKSQIRVLSTLGTGGIASPFISAVEDGLALVGSVLAVIATFAAATLIVLGLAATGLAVQRFRRRAIRIEQHLESAPRPS